jgi:hypothetical protein
MSGIVLPQSPVFIVGSPRSGTSALIDAFFAAGYHGYREGHLLSLLRHADQLVDRHFRIFAHGNKQELISNADPAALKAGMFAVLRNMMEGLNPVAPWVDKTGGPEMILAAPIIKQLWPAARFVFARRRAIENIVSRLKKFPQHNFDYHCRDWSATMAAWRSVREGLGDAAIEIDQHDLIADPHHQAERLGEFLTITPALRQRMAQSLLNNRPQQTAPGTASRSLTLAALDWTAQQRSVFAQFCGVEMRAFGYSEDETYYLPAASVKR